MKKLISIVLILCMLFSFASCSANTSASNKGAEEKLEESKETEVQEVHLLVSGKEKIEEGGTISANSIGIKNSFNVIVNGKLCTNYEVTASDESVATFEKNPNGSVYYTSQKAGGTEFTIKILEEEHTFGLSVAGGVIKREFKKVLDNDRYFAADELYVLNLISGYSLDQYGNPIYEIDKVVSVEEANGILSKLLVGYSEEDKTKILNTLEISPANIAGLSREKAYSKISSLLLTDVEKGVTLLDTIEGINDETKWHWEYARTAQQNLEKAKYYNNFASIGIDAYVIPEGLGKTTLTEDEALALVGRAPCIVQNRVQNIPDVLMYSIAAGYGAPGDAFTPWYGPKGGGKDVERWAGDWDGEVQLAHGWFTCCGGASNYVSYLIKDDYDEQGWIQYLGDGNHHFNWIKENGVYYIYDQTHYSCTGIYVKNPQTQVIIECDSLQDFVDNKWPSFYSNKELLTHIYYAENNGRPNIGNFGTLVYQKENEGKMGMLYVKPGEKDHIDFAVPTVEIPGYNVFKFVKPLGMDNILEMIEERTNAYKNL